MLMFVTMTAFFLITRHDSTIVSPIKSTGKLNASADLSPFNATAYWNVEKLRVKTTPLNLTIVNNSMTALYNGVIYNRTELSYEIPNWVGAHPATLTINATMFTPTNASKNLGLMPGVAVFHGYGGRRQDMFDYALSIVTLNCCVIVPDLPGHGDSEGPRPLPQYLLYGGDFNKSSFTYLVFCDGIQAIQVLESMTKTVDTSRLAITGMSYGGWTSLGVGAICRDKIKLVMPWACWGNFSTMDPNSMWYNLANSTPAEFQAWQAQKGATMDPIDYIGVKNYPEICLFAGTNDEFFQYSGINDTYNMILSNAGGKWLSITPNGHHQLGKDFTPQYMIKYKFFGGPAPPVITGFPGQKSIAGVSDHMQLQVKITCAAAVERVDVCYKYKGIIGDPWRNNTMVETSPGSGTWEGGIDAYWAGSDVDYFVIVYLANQGGDVVFTSQIYSAGTLNDYIAFLPIIGIIAAITLLAFAVLKYRYTYEVKHADPAKQKLAKVHFLVENALLGVTEVAIFGSLALPWGKLSMSTIPNLQPVSWSGIYIMNEYLSYPGVLGSAAYYFSFMLFLFFTVFALTSLLNPLLSSLLNCIWPILFTLLVSILAKALGVTFSPSMIGFGVYVFLFSAIGQGGIWIWKQIYQKRLNIPQRNLVILLKELRK